LIIYLKRAYSLRTPISVLGGTLFTKTLLLTVALAASSFGAITDAGASADVAATLLTIHDFEIMAGGPSAAYSSLYGSEQISGMRVGPADSGGWLLTTSVCGQGITMTLADPATASRLWFGTDGNCCSTGFEAILETFNTKGSSRPGQLHCQYE
jgi:hypothetical protein